MVSIEDIKKLRDQTGASPVEIKKALDQAGGDFDKAKEILEKVGLAKVAKKAGNETTEGIVDFYVHPNGKTGVLMELRCQTDFVAKSPDFKNLAHEICLQIAAMKPENVPALLSQPWMKGDGAKTIKNVIEETTAKIGENIEVKQFACYQI